MSEVKTVTLAAIPGQPTVKLGMVPPKVAPKVVRLRTFLLGPVGKPPPDVIDYAAKARTALNRMYLNDQYGCCVISGKAHSFGVWTGNDGAEPVQFSDQEILTRYNQLKAGPGDSGCIISDVFDWLCKPGNGFKDTAGAVHGADGYVAIDVTDRNEVKTALYLFGALTIGFMVTNDMVRTAREGAVWAAFNPWDIAGGHDVSVIGCNDQGVQLSTWGVVLTMAWSVFQNRQCVTECYAPLAPDWYGSDKVNAATQLDYAALKKAIDSLKGGVVPPIPDPVPPPPVVPPPPIVPPPPPAPVVVVSDVVLHHPLLGTIKGTSTPRTPAAAGWHLPTIDDLKGMFADAVQLLQSDAALSVEAAVWQVVADAKAGKYGAVLADVIAVTPAAVLLYQQLVALVQKWKGSFRVVPVDGSARLCAPAPVSSWWTDHAADIAAVIEALLKLLQQRQAA